MSKIEISVPSIPAFIEEHIKYLKKSGHELIEVGGATAESNTIKWLSRKENKRKFANAWVLNEWIVAEEKHYAKIKGWELVDKGAEKAYQNDLEDGVEGLDPDSSWGRSIYIIQLMSGNFVVDMKDSGFRSATHSMTKKEWKELGFTEDNVVFEKAEEWLQ